MKKNILNIIVVTVLLGGAIAAYMYFQQQQPKPEAAQVQELVPPPILPEPLKPVMRQVLDAPSTNPELPQLDTSDSFVLDALTSLIENKSLMNIFRTEQLIHNIVATIDSLPSQRAPMSAMPVEAAKGKFITMESKGALAISPKNQARYTPYVRFAEEANAKKFVELYVRLYPLFQQSYEELGYPNKYFNDRLIVVLDNLLAAPEIKEPVQLIQPKYYYLYADSNIEGRSIGQKILMRIGSNNEMIIKTKLKDIKQELILHMHEKKIDSAV
jgi:hypothetical protein